jgi:hypothetical protein
MSKRAEQVEASGEYLRRRHATLDARVEELSARARLTSEEALELAGLKKEKLAAKDRLAGL